jgi:hypothetical protein
MGELRLWGRRRQRHRDETGKVRALTMDDIRRIKPIAEINPGMIDTAGRADEGRAAEQAIAGRKR